MVEKLLQVLVFAKLPNLHGFRKTSSVSETVFIVIVSKTCNYTFLHHSHQHPFCFCLPAGKNIDISICFGLLVVYCSTGPVFARAYGRRMLGTIARRTLGNNDSRAVDAIACTFCCASYTFPDTSASGSRARERKHPGCLADSHPEIPSAAQLHYFRCETLRHSNTPATSPCSNTGKENGSTPAGKLQTEAVIAAAKTNTHSLGRFVRVKTAVSFKLGYKHGHVPTTLRPP